MDEGELKLAEMENSNLQRVISEVERALASSTRDTRPFFENLLRNMKGRVVELEERTKEATKEKAAHEQQEAAILALARQESALNAREQETYSGFLKEAYFSKRDFAQLDEFYRHSWNRLSDNGKAEMSRRVWEGVRHQEYQFTDLPAAVQEKETARAYAAIKGEDTELSRTDRIPADEKKRFLQACDERKSREARQILNHDCFTKNLSVTSPSEKDEKSASVGHADLDLSGIDLSGLKGNESTVAVPPKELAQDVSATQRTR